MTNFKWNFPVKRKEEKGVAPIQKVFFAKDSSTVIPEVAESLVRESIQNSLDAKIPGSEDPMRIRFALSSQNNEIPFSDFSKYIEGLNIHLESKGADIPKLPEWGKSVPFLTIEDFNTHGLRGDFTVDMPKEPSNDFCYFWRNLVGFTGKGGNERGKWGIGKAVYPATSTINTFFGSTVRNPDEGSLLMGLSVLNLHQLDDNPDQYFVPYGDFGVFNDSEKHFVLPLVDEKVNSDLKRLFNCDRSNETGLSIMIPYPDSKIKAANLTLSTIQQYYYPLLKGKLVVTIIDGTEKIVIYKDNLLEVLDKLIIDIPGGEEDQKWNSEIQNLKTICDFASWAASRSEDDFTCLSPPPAENVPTWNISLFTDINLETLRDKYHNGERIALKIPLFIKKADEEGELCYFKVFLWNDVTYKGIFTEYIREDLNIPEINPDLRELGVKALVIVDSDPNNENQALATMVGLSENPAHTRWDKNADKFQKAEYRNGDSSLSFIINSLNRLCKRFLQKPMEDVNDSILADLFPIFEEDKPALPPIPNPPPDDHPRELPDPIPSGPSRKFILTRNSDGFRIIKNPDYEENLKTLVVAAGYRLKRGNAIKKHKIEDFDFNSDISIMSKGLKEQQKESNKVKYIITDQNFELRMQDFDINRDLEVSYTAL